MAPKPITIVQGAQLGSEGKGLVTAYLCVREKVDFAVRTGATNAGHTFYHNGVPYKMQQLPCGWANPRTSLVIGAGALIDPDILTREVRTAREAGYTGSIFIDPRAGVHLPVHHDASTASGRHHAIGATGKGCSEALISRIRGRGKGGLLFGGIAGDLDLGGRVHLVDTEELLNAAVDSGRKILLEGTQGQGLDLYLGPYPYTTHKQTGPAQWMLEAGLSPSLPVDIVSVVRTYPIRVAGNSGPLPREISWPILAFEINTKRSEADLPPLVAQRSVDVFMQALDEAAKSLPIPPGCRPQNQEDWPDRVTYASTLSELNAAAWSLLPNGCREDLLRLFELTTVTKKLRRIARLDLEDLSRLSRQVRPNRVMVTFMNYQFPHKWFCTDCAPLSPGEWAYLDMISGACSAPVTHVSWGPGSRHIQPV